MFMVSALELGKLAHLNFVFSKLSTFEVEDDQTHPEKENNSTEKDAFLPSKATLSKRSLFDVSSTTNTDFENTVNAEVSYVLSIISIEKQ